MELLLTSYFIRVSHESVQRTKGKVVKRCIYKSKAESFNHEESAYVICIYYGFLGQINKEELTP